MKLFILKTSFYDDKVYARVCDYIKKLKFELLGFLTLNNDEVDIPTCGYPTYHFSKIMESDYDFVFVAYPDETGDKKVLSILKNFVPEEKIGFLNWLLKTIMAAKYASTKDKDIQETLRWWRDNDITIFNQYLDGVPDTYDEIFEDDSCGLPYLIFKTVEGKERKMFLPKNDKFGVVDGKKVYVNLMKEQLPTSPLLYIKGEHKINEGDILIDAGVCEGNFALRYADICKKVYLFEPEEEWREPLYHTFKDFGDKVEFIPKFVSNVSEGNFVALDDVIDTSEKGNKYFLKMDIEGAEVDALNGAKNLLTKNKFKASICSYHKHGDESKIKNIFKRYRYKTWTSDGYMFFIYDPEIWNTLDFRRGIVYAKNY